MTTRHAIVAAARGWIGTPYHHQATLRGEGCDCLGLVRGVWREVQGAEPEAPPPYTPDWSEAGGAEPLYEAAMRHMIQVPLDAVQAGDVLLFRLRPAMVAKHMAILTDPRRMIHAQSRDRVREVVLTEGWRRRIAAAFAFPSVED